MGWWVYPSKSMILDRGEVPEGRRQTYGLDLKRSTLACLYGKAGG